MGSASISVLRDIFTEANFVHRSAFEINTEMETSAAIALSNVMDVLGLLTHNATSVYKVTFKLQAGAWGAAVVVTLW